MARSTAVSRMMRWCWLIGLCAQLVGCASEPPAVSAAGSAQILLMVAVPPTHYRADDTYAGAPTWSSDPLAQQRVVNALAREQGLRVTGSWPMPALGVQCFTLELPASMVASELIQRLRRDPRVESVQLLQQFHGLSHNDPLFPLQPTAKPWHLAEVHQRLTGHGVRVAVVDTGVQLDHPDLAGQVVLARNLVEDQGFPEESHGTAVSGVIAAKADNRVGMVGVAPEAEILALRACWAKTKIGLAATCNSFTLAKALQLAIDEHAQIINLSLSGPDDVLLGRLLEAAMARGIAVVAAVDVAVPAGGFPADVPGVVAVSGSEGAAPVFVHWVRAPGRDIPATLPGGRWDLVNGSSFAAAEVSGLLALLRQAHPELSTRQLALSLPTSGLASAIDICALFGHGVAACDMVHDGSSRSLH